MRYEILRKQRGCRLMHLRLDVEIISTADAISFRFYGEGPGRLENRSGGYLKPPHARTTLATLCCRFCWRYFVFEMGTVAGYCIFSRQIILAEERKISHLQHLVSHLQHLVVRKPSRYFDTVNLSSFWLCGGIAALHCTHAETSLHPPLADLLVIAHAAGGPRVYMPPQSQSARTTLHPSEKHDIASDRARLDSRVFLSTPPPPRSIRLCLRSPHACAVCCGFPRAYVRSACSQTDFESKFEAERISRLEREGRILKQLADHEQEVATDFETERVSHGMEVDTYGRFKIQPP